MSTHPSTRTHAGYGTSPLDSSTRNPKGTPPRLSETLPRTTGKKLRRDSAAPLMHTPPISASSRQEYFTAASTNPLQVDSQRSVSGSTIDHRPSSVRHRRRRYKTETQVTDTEDDEQTTNVELNTSDEEEDNYDESASSDEEEDDDDEEQDNDDRLLRTKGGNAKDPVRRGLVHQMDDQIRISGLGRLDNVSLHPWTQTLLLDDEIEVNIGGYRYDNTRLFFYRVSCVLSLGIVWLVCRWMPHWWVSWVGQKVPLQDAQWLVFLVCLPQCKYFQPIANTIFLLLAIESIQ